MKNVNGTNNIISSHVSMTDYTQVRTLIKCVSKHISALVDDLIQTEKLPYSRWLRGWTQMTCEESFTLLQVLSLHPVVKERYGMPCVVDGRTQRWLGFNSGVRALGYAIRMLEQHFDYEIRKYPFIRTALEIANQSTNLVSTIRRTLRVSYGTALLQPSVNSILFRGWSAVAIIATSLCMTKWTPCKSPCTCRTVRDIIDDLPELEHQLHSLKESVE